MHLKRAMRALVGALAAAVALAVPLDEPEGQESPPPPNILLITTDDNSAEVLYEAMPNVVQRIGGEGATFENATVAQSLCCPNRAVWQRGQYPHNTRVLGNLPPEGGFETFRARGLQNDTYATRIGAAGYNTTYLGKYMNGHEKYLTYRIPGWQTFMGGGPSAKCLSINGRQRCPSTYKPQPHDKWMVDRAAPRVAGWSKTAGPDLMVLSLYNPHGPIEFPSTYASMFSGAHPDSQAFNEADVSDKPAWVRSQPALGARSTSDLIGWHQRRLRGAAYTDALIGRVLDALQSSGEADNTFVLFSNDNGYKVGEHRLDSKNTPYAEDEFFPLLVRGPGIPAGGVREEMVSSVDLRPTLEDMANAATPDYVDGESLLPLAQGQEGVTWRRYAYAESLKTTSRIGPAGTFTIPPWRAVFSATGSYHSYLTTGEEEFYNNVLDPWQLDGRITIEEEAEAALARAAISEFKDCAGATCREAGK